MQVGGFPTTPILLNPLEPPNPPNYSESLRRSMIDFNSSTLGF